MKIETIKTEKAIVERFQFWTFQIVIKMAKQTVKISIETASRKKAEKARADGQIKNYRKAPKKRPEQVETLIRVHPIIGWIWQSEYRRKVSE